MVKKYLMITILFLTATSQAKILVISDIDDTLKVTNVRSTMGAASSAVDEYSRFAGMSELFQEIKQAHPDTEFYYVSLAPQFWMSHLHREFLDDNHFPVTALYTNQGFEQDPDLKQKVIRKILSAEQADQIIYFGDNGQFDPLVYQQMTKEFPDIPARTYIRDAYSVRSSENVNSARDGQIGFVTAVEVALDLIQNDLLPAPMYSAIENAVYKSLQNDDGYDTFGLMVFPWWQDCRDFVWRWNVTQPSEKFLRIKKAITSRCDLVDTAKN